MSDLALAGDGPVNLSNVKGVKQRRPSLSGFPATRTLVEEESGSIILLDKVDGIIATLPAPAIGLVYEFMVTVTVTSNNYKIITNAVTVFLTGSYLEIDTDTANALAGRTGNGTTHIAITMNGTTTGGILGTRLKFTCISATLWLVEGTMNGSGTVATAFATS